MDASAQVTFSFLSSLLFSLGSWHMGECSHSQIESSSSVAGVSGNILLTYPDMWYFSDFGTSQADRADQPSEFLLWRWIFLGKASFLLHRGHYQWVPSSPVAHTGSNCCANLYLIGPCSSASKDCMSHRSIREFRCSQMEETLFQTRLLENNRYLCKTKENFFSLIAIFTPGSISWQVLQEPWVHIISMWDGWPNTTLLGAPPKEIKLACLNDTNTSVYPITVHNNQETETT